MGFSKEFIKKLKEVYPYSIFPQLAEDGDWVTLSKYLDEEVITEPKMHCEEILDYINNGKVDELKADIEERMAHYEKELEILSMFQEEANAEFGADYEL